MSDQCYMNTKGDEPTYVKNPSECDSESLLGSILLSSSCINNTASISQSSKPIRKAWPFAYDQPTLQQGGAAYRVFHKNNEYCNNF